MPSTDTTRTAMQILLHAGAARNHIHEAVSAATAWRLGECPTLLDAAEDALREAHRSQTDLIQAEARGDRVDLTVLFVHAQDTLMTTKSELTMARALIGLADAVASRLDADPLTIGADHD